MRLTFACVLASMLSTAYTQSVNIATPTQGQTLTRGSQLVVRIRRPPILSSVAEIGVGITMNHCFTTPCQDGLGPVLFTGAFTPHSDSSTGSIVPFQDYTITVPDLGPGNAILYVAHASIVGANGFMFNEVVNQTVVLV